MRERKIRSALGEMNRGIFPIAAAAVGVLNNLSYVWCAEANLLSASADSEMYPMRLTFIGVIAGYCRVFT